MTFDVAIYIVNTYPTGAKLLYKEVRRLIVYKTNIFKLLKERGYNQTRIQKERLLPAQTAQNIKAGKSITLDTLNKICVMCKCQPGDLVEVIPSDEEKLKYY